MIIKSKSKQPQSGKLAPAAKGVKVSSRSKKDSEDKSSGFNFVKNTFLMLFCLLVAAVAYLSFFGEPVFLRGKIPKEIMDFLGLTEETAATQVLREAGAPKLTVYGTKSNDPSIPMNGSVEEIVKTMRPDIYFKNKDTLTYKEQALNNRAPYQKQAFHIMLSTFYKATPDGVGFLDLAYQAPNFYFVRAVAQDSRTKNAFMDQLRSKVLDFKETPETTVKDGSVEFSIHGSFQQPKSLEFRNIPLVEPSRIKSEIFTLRTLASANQVRLNGLEKPIEDNLGVYKRVVLRTTTEADYPSLLNFADALQRSDIAFGIQKFTSKPAGPEKMQSALEFVLYAVAK
jgi:hypothetical protein